MWDTFIKRLAEWAMRLLAVAFIMLAAAVVLFTAYALLAEG